MDWSDPISAIFAYQGTQDTNAANLDMANKNNAWSAQQYAWRYQTQVKDLEAAGLNPMLAYSQSPGSAPTAQQIQFQNPLSSAVDAYNQSRKTSQDVARTPSQIKLQGAQAHSAEASAKLNAKQESLVEANTKKVIAETENVPLEGRRLERLSALLAEQLNVAFQEMQNKIAARDVMTATIKKLSVETDLFKLDLKAQQDFNNLGKEVRQLQPIIDLIKPFIRAR